MPVVGYIGLETPERYASCLHAFREGLVHRVAKLSHTGTPIDPRNTAVLQEIGGQYFAIDPALVDVGVPPPIIPLESWLADWPPDLPTSEAPIRLSAAR